MSSEQQHPHQFAQYRQGNRHKLSLLQQRTGSPRLLWFILHKGLKRFYETGSTAGVQAAHAKKLRMRLAALDTSTVIEDMDLPGFKLHDLKGQGKGRWAISVNGNWRLTFEFRDGNAFVLDYEDYH